jgi:hypothetical protein
MKILVYGLINGIFFGFFLQRGQVLRYEKQLGALRLMDMTIVKFMLSSILVAMVGVYLLQDLGLGKLSIKATVLGGNILGGLGVVRLLSRHRNGRGGRGPLGSVLGYPRHAYRRRPFCRGLPFFETDGTHLGKLWQAHPTPATGDQSLVNHPFHDSGKPWSILLV